MFTDVPMLHAYRRLGFVHRREYRFCAHLHCKLALFSLALVLLASKANADDVDFNSVIRPILSEHCLTCHGPDAATREADLRLDNAEDAKHVLESEPGSPSEFIRRIFTDDASEIMPPPDAKKQLSDGQRELLKQWCEAGAEYQVHWSFREIRRPQVPRMEQASDLVNPIDSFVLEKLAESGLKFSPPASSLTVLRRATLELTGLPPTLDEIEQFQRQVADSSPDVAYEALLERLVESERYGEHMAVSWLEAARYADTDGYQNDRYRYQHAWRDWVIRAYNQNMPYDQFLLEQLAGDLLHDATLWQQVATGFGRNHRINSEDGSIPEEWRIENVADRVDTLGTAVLGLTLGCARCHDHKYDPISQRDYYQLFAYFNSIAEHGVGPNNGNSPPFVKLPDSWPKLSEQEDKLIAPDAVELKPARKDSGNGLLRPQAGDPTTVMVMHELAEPRPTYVLLRGQYDAPDTSEELLPRVPDILSAGLESQPANRLELAQWLVNPKHPLTARVAVNRIWQQFFGRGLVESSENLGGQGALPSHPELLDWLASELMDSGWDIQHVQKLIMSSKTYRQVSNASGRASKVDPDNRLLSRGTRVRLSAFVVRDSALAFSGLLANNVGGPSVKPYMPPKVWSSISNNKYEQGKGEDLYRRSLYTYWRRTIPPPTMVNFNAAAREVCIVRTELTNTPLQALTLLNNKTFIEASRHLAERMLEAGKVEDAIRSGYMLVLTRAPTDPELQLMTELYRETRKEYRTKNNEARMLLAIGESSRDESIDVSRHAAMTLVASTIMNLDEAINKE